MSDIDQGNEPSNSSETAVSVDTNPVEQVVDQPNEDQVANNPSDGVSGVDGQTKPKYTKEEKAQHAYDKRISTLVAQRNELQAKLEQQEAAKNSVPDSMIGLKRQDTLITTRKSKQLNRLSLKRLNHSCYIV